MAADFLMYQDDSGQLQLTVIVVLLVVVIVVVVVVVVVAPVLVFLSNHKGGTGFTNILGEPQSVALLFVLIVVAAVVGILSKV